MTMMVQAKPELELNSTISRLHHAEMEMLLVARDSVYVFVVQNYHQTVSVTFSVTDKKEMKLKL